MKLNGVCEYCGKPFTTKSYRQKTCSEVCKRSYYLERIANGKKVKKINAEMTQHDYDNMVIYAEHPNLLSKKIWYDGKELSVIVKKMTPQMRKKIIEREKKSTPPPNLL